MENQSGFLIQTKFESQIEYILIDELNVDKYLDACKYLSSIQFLI